jgi:hypothetical protein
MDLKREKLGITWEQAARDVGGNPADARRRISASTLKRTALGGQMEADGVLAMVKWVGLTVSDFTVRSFPHPRRHSERRGRFDSRSFYKAVDARRKSEDLSWKEVARAIGGFSAGMLMSLRTRHRMSIDQVVRLSAWLGAVPEDFTYAAP